MEFTYFNFSYFNILTIKIIFISVQSLQPCRCTKPINAEHSLKGEMRTENVDKRHNSKKYC